MFGGWWRGAVGLLLALLVGAASGSLIALRTTPAAEWLAETRPLAARDPSLPRDPPEAVLPDDTTYPPLATGIPMRRARLGVLPFRIAFLVPRDWERVQLAVAEARWILPGNPDGAYSVRVENVTGERLTLEEAVELRLQALYRGQPTLQVLDQGGNQIVFTYIAAERRRLSVVRWVDPDRAGAAVVEISAVGRLSDRVGMIDLVDRIADSASKD